MRVVCRSLFVAALLLSTSAVAVPVAPFPVPLRNDDGTVVMGRLFGDEHLSWAEDLEGHALKWEPTIGAWHYATVGPDGRLAPLPYRAGVTAPHLLGLDKHLRPSPRVVERALARRAKVQRAPKEAPKRAPLLGTVPNLVLLVKFNCTAAAGGCSATNQRAPKFTAAAFDTLFNGPTNSVKAFYNEVSYGKVQLHSTIATNAWIQLPKNDAYYVYNDDHETGGYPEHMVRDAIAVLNQQGFNFKAFDSNNDNIIDAIDVIHVGYGYEYSGQQWDVHSHYMNLQGQNLHFQTHDGVWITGYHTEPEYQADGTSITAIGTIVHETAHFFGLPDLYDYTGTSAGLGMWSLMAAGSWGGMDPSYPDGTRPTHPDVWSKWVLGYLTPTHVTSNQTGLRLRPTQSNAEAVALNTGMPLNQVFLLENRFRAGFDGSIPGSGLAIYHVDENQYLNGSDNNDRDHYLVDLEQADGLRELNMSRSEDGDLGDVWPYGSKTAFTPTSTPNSKAYGQSTSKINVLNIRRSGNDILFDVDVGVGALKPNGEACAAGSQCSSSFCVDGVCCNSVCGAGQCDACSRAAGADVDGTCKLLTVACNDGNNCTTGDVCQSGICTGVAVTCPAADECHWASTCNPSTGSCTSSTKADGTDCNDGNACTTNDTCQAGVCVAGTSSVNCAAPDACHEASACNPATGQCAPFPVKPDGTACSDGNACTSGDSCKSGICAPTKVTQCQGAQPCRAASLCDPGTGACIPGAVFPDGTACSDGNACSTGDRCQSGVCVGGTIQTVCPAPSPCHEAGVCDPNTGACIAPPKPDGTACNDLDACTFGDACLTGVCVPASTKECPGADACRAASTCDPTSGACVPGAAKADGIACDDQSSCTINDRCQGGTCVGTLAQSVCGAPDACHEAGVCDPSTGKCVAPPKPDGTSCDDGNACTRIDSCQAGVCVGGSPVSCPATGACFESLGCDWQTGRCVNRALPAGTACDDGNACTESDVCISNVCTGAKRSCEPIDECHRAGQCDSLTGACTSPAVEDGTQCSGGTCQGGECVASGASPASEQGCGCAAGAGGSEPLLLVGLFALGLLRRRGGLRRA